MKGLIKLALLIAVGYFGYTELLPRFRAHQESQAADRQAVDDGQQARECVALATSLRDDFALEIRQFARPPVDASEWSTFMLRTSGQLSSADSSCRCPHAACLSAGAALLEQRKLLNQLDAVVRGRSAGTANPAVSMERIDQLLVRARSEAE